MNTYAYVGNNPLFKYDMNKLCAICNSKIKIATVTKQLTIHEKIPDFEEDITILEVLVKVSDFGTYNADDGPQNICKTCFGNTVGAYKFHSICNKSVANLLAYLDHQNEMKNKNEAEESSELLESDALKSPDEDIKTDSLEDILEINRNEDEMHMIEEGDESQRNKNDDKEGVTKQEPKKKVKCKVCHKWYCDTYIAVHRRLHTGHQPYTCKFCDRKFSDRSSIKRHEVTHVQERPYLCRFCGKSFKHPANLRMHETTHNTERPFECDICNKRYRTKMILKDHYKIHAAEKDFQCEICAKTFNFRKHLKQHMVTHIDEKRHECNLCQKRFTQAHSLRTHLLKYCKGSDDSLE